MAKQQRRASVKEPWGAGSTISIQLKLGLKLKQTASGQRSGVGGFEGSEGVRANVLSAAVYPHPHPPVRKNSHRTFMFCMDPILGSSGESGPLEWTPRPATPLGQRGSEGYPNVIKIWCEVYSEFRTRLKNVRNFSTVFIDGIAGAAMERDNVNNSAYVCFANQFLLIANQFRISEQKS